MKKRIVAISLACTLLAFVSLFAPAGANGSGVFTTNENGLTYGSASMAQSADGEPDLIAVVTTDGKEAYVYKKDLDKAAQGASTPEEAIELMTERNAKMFESVRGNLERKGYSVDAKSVEAILNSVSSNLSNASVAAVLKEGGSHSQKIPLDTLEDALDEAELELATSIPAYDKNGTTIVGEFLVG